MTVALPLTFSIPEEKQDIEIVTIKDIDHPLMKYPIENIIIELPPNGKAIGLKISRYEHHNLPYTSKSDQNSYY